MANEIKYKVIDGTSFHQKTSPTVCDILNRFLHSEKRLKLYYGDVETGRDWNEENDTTGTIGRSTGTSKIPLLILTKRSHGGGAILDHCIVKIKSGGVTLYQHPKYKAPVVEIQSGDDGEYSYRTVVNGEVYGLHKTHRSAVICKNKLI